mmetsp:Transcript_9852/g.19661  ORF Transcript_9852/g.19661 Transcript_9852/m.19661 type:complete len:120 (-) Transcript_9852:653-1012(-)|eukprot:CAMPEP_0181298666 /NCGR_PEP_ID=MMETSP1101-20121128/5909_1 /TAXON_ID=46948 /ORGANISM="Rhodomonas abbreviata, Strain Caron Lab Isolate" /LENGTH=119 /DNA_ID=CAMNT_0023403713 /DNA_START=204 /DNA_END=563 /DNA_ORIENTATION=+
MASAFMLAAGVAAAALAGRAILRQAQTGGPAAGAGFFSHFSGAIRGGSEKGFEEPMSRAEAAKILGVRVGADKETIGKVHRKLMILNHPDRGGSPFLATKVNEAKETLTGGNKSNNPFS